MAELGSFSKARHALVGAAAAATGVLGATGVIGAHHPDRYETWHVTASPGSGSDVAIRVVFDQDFGDTPAHGPLLYVQDGPTDIRVTSPDAPTNLRVDADAGGETEIRIGDADVEITGQHRYVLEYTLPDLTVAGTLDLDLLTGDDEFPTDHVELVVTGFRLDAANCQVGYRDDGCTVTTGGDLYRMVADDVAAGEGVRFNSEITGATDVVDVARPAIPPRRNATTEALLGGSLGLLGAAAAAPVYALARRRGRNEVFAGGAAVAAYGELPAPGTAAAAVAETSLVADERLDDLTTIEFVPPKGIAPWQAAALLSERFDGDTAVETFLSGMAGVEALTFTDEGGKLVIASGPRLAELGPDDRRLVDQILAIGDPLTTGSYDPKFATAWTNIAGELRARLRSSGWWRHGNPADTLSAGGGGRFVAAFVVIAVFAFGAPLLGALTGGGWPAAIAFAVVVPAVVAWFAYRVLLPSRSAPGSALALRSESFRRFLDASEGRHVEWAWQQGLLREYSAWAVGLGEADAWSAALARANVPAPEVRSAQGPLVVHRSGSALRRSRQRPAPTGGGSRGRSGSSGGSRTRVRSGGRRGGGGTRRGRW